MTYGKGALTHFATFKRKYFENTSGIDTTFKRAVDQDLYLKLEEVGKHIFLDDYLYNYRVNQNSISANKNVYKARYWHFIAQKNAFKRRRLSNQIIINLSKKGYCLLVDDFYIQRAKHEAQTGEICNKYYFILKSIYYNPLKNTKYKIKCLLFPTFH